MHYAAKNCRRDVVQFLLEKGAFPNAKNCLGETPIQAAPKKGYDLKDLFKQKSHWSAPQDDVSAATASDPNQDDDHMSHSLPKPKR